VIPIKLVYLVLAAVPLQLGFLACHFLLIFYFPVSPLVREELPLLYLAATYLQWLFVAFVISKRTKVCRVPILMHLPHLLSFLPLLRHIILAANRTPSDISSLSLAWVHSVATHSFSLVATWLWQQRKLFSASAVDLLRQEFVPLALYALAALTTIVLYAGLDWSFARTPLPLAVGIIQMLLNIAVTGVLLYRDRGSLKIFAIIAAVVFSLANGLLLFDHAQGDIGVELALAATSFTQIFSLFVFMLHSKHDIRGIENGDSRAQ